MNSNTQHTDSSTRYLELPDGVLAYDDAGRGPLIVATPAMLDLRSELRFLVPLLVDHGFRVVTVDQRDVDWPDPESEARWIVSQLGSELLLLEGAGHHPQVEYPAEVAEAVAAFAEQLG
jgi:pimeloyl-ACP methyl ester carboxylesterase